LQKTDIFKRLMWFSFQGDDNWIPLPIDRVKEIQHQNSQGIKPADIKDLTIVVEVKAKERTYDYENVVGQDSLTRLDDTKTKKRPSKSRSKNKNKRVEKTGIEVNPNEGKSIAKKAIETKGVEKKSTERKPITKKPLE